MTSALATGPLPALIDYYERMPDAPPFGFSMEKISFAVVLERSGALAKPGLVDLRRKNERGKPLHELMLVPDGGGRSGTGITPFFCWDNTGYALGRDNKGDAARAKKMFAAFRDLHLEMRKEVGDDPGFATLCKFLEKWDPADAETLPDWEETAGKNVVFTLRGQEGYVHQSRAVKAAWLRRVERELAEHGGQRGVSLTSGEEEPLARTHPMLSGVTGANTMGAAIVSFNFDSATSYGREQSYNSPVGIRDAFRYTTALNRLLADPTRRVQVGDATVVFWAGRPEGAPAEGDFRAIFGGQAVSQPEPGESALTTARVQASLKSTRRGLPGEDVPGDTPFYILGLSPNASRLNVRYWLAGTVAQFRDALLQHQSKLGMASVVVRKDEIWLDESLPTESDGKKQARIRLLSRLEQDARPLTIQDILDETVLAKRGMPDRERVNPRLAGEVMRSALQGRPLPDSLWLAVLERALVEGLSDPDKRTAWFEARRRRMAILKSCLNDHLRLSSQKGLTVDAYLDKMHPAPSYHCGRLMAAIACAQELALGQVGSSVIRRHLSSVVANPALSLGRLQALALVAHVSKLEGNLPDLFTDLMKEINCAIGSYPPEVLRRTEQTLFMLGMFHQMAVLDRIRSTHRLRTAMGEWVRSKGERDLANALAAAGVTYVYEAQAALTGGQDRYPDFFLPRGEDCNCVYIEYLGMDTPEYNARWETKQREYAKAAITPAGGARGRLVVIDARKAPMDQATIISALIKHGVISERSSTDSKENPNV
ncbi:MAG: type I-C CRISPR-associated protein Cas8c/Csd1 [Phycisphaerales bacterium]|nr:type I-C CRISPR-associated protein Cas8c/Csd1 [Phycisphaerales bacterium]